MWIVNGNQMRAVDSEMIDHYRYPALLLMETAGQKAANFIIEKYPHVKSFLVVCGAGNNGSDGFVTARYLDKAGKDPLVVLTHPFEKLSGNSLINFEILKHRGIHFLVYSAESQSKIKQFLSEGAIIIDAMLGVGLTGNLSEPIAGILNFLRSFRQSVVALDLPTGLSADTGAVTNLPLKCEYTIAFQLPKICHYITPAANFCGQTEVVDIGIYPKVIEDKGYKITLLTPALIRSWYRPRVNDAHKGTYGHVLFAGGSKGKGGAVALSANAATEIGAGLCSAFIPGSVACSFHRTTLENMSIPYGTSAVPYLNETSADVFTSYLSDKEVVAIGPGLGNTPDTIQFMRNALPEINNPLILDADAINVIAENPDLWDVLPRTNEVIFTPHPGEMSRLMGLTVEEIQQNRLEIALEFSSKKNVIVVLKGSGTIVAHPDGRAYISSIGNPGMATGGSGDVLTGVIAGLIAQGYSPFLSAAMGVYIHAYSGDFVMRQFGHEGVTATKIIRNLGQAFLLIRQEE